MIRSPRSLSALALAALLLGGCQARLPVGIDTLGAAFVLPPLGEADRIAVVTAGQGTAPPAGPGATSPGTPAASTPPASGSGGSGGGGAPGPAPAPASGTFTGQVIG